VSDDRDEAITRRAATLGELVALKNREYGNSVERSAEILAILYPAGIEKQNYRDLLLVVRVIDKLSRIATSKDAFGESPWIDIAGYGILGSLIDG
jgi:hypothetical protein